MSHPDSLTRRSFSEPGRSGPPQSGVFRSSMADIGRPCLCQLSSSMLDRLAVRVIARQ